MTILTLIMASLVSWYHRSIIHVLTGCPLHFPDLWLVRCHNSMLWLAGCDTHDVSSTHLHCPWHSFEPQVPNNNERSVWPLYTHGPLITFVHTPVIIKASTGSGTRLFYTPRIYINALYGFTHHNSEYIFIVCCICSAYFHWKSGAMICAMIGSTLHISLSWLPLFLLPPSVSICCVESCQCCQFPGLWLVRRWQYWPLIGWCQLWWWSHRWNTSLTVVTGLVSCLLPGSVKTENYEVRK